MAGRFLIIFSIFIDIVYKKLIILAINLVVEYREPDKFKVCSYLMEATGLGGGFD